jgi:hypothetical protein
MHVQLCETMANMLQPLEMSVTMADPMEEDCPLVAVSNGFKALTGYDKSLALYRNCRFLLDGVPPELQNEETRMRIRMFCYNCVVNHQQGKPLPQYELFTQTNATLQGELFRNDFLLHCALFYDKPYILGLQVNGDKVPDSFSYLKHTLRNLFALISQKQMTRLTQTIQVLAANRGKVPRGVQANLLKNPRIKAKKRHGHSMEVLSESEDEDDTVDEDEAEYAEEAGPGGLPVVHSGSSSEMADSRPASSPGTPLPEGPSPQTKAPTTQPSGAGPRTGPTTDSRRAPPVTGAYPSSNESGSPDSSPPVGTTRTTPPPAAGDARAGGGEKKARRVRRPGGQNGADRGSPRKPRGPGREKGYLVTTVRSLFQDFEAEESVKRGRARSQEGDRSRGGAATSRPSGPNFVSWTRVRVPSDTASDPGHWDLDNELEQAEACVQSAREESTGSKESDAEKSPRQEDPKPDSRSPRPGLTRAHSL